METCVLIPQQLSLSVATGTMEVSVHSNTRIPRGTVLLPFQGTVRLDKIENRSSLNDNDIRLRFGCYDECTAAGGRACNWVRFLRVASTFNESVNIVGSRLHGEPVFEATRDIPPNVELLAFLLPPRPHDLFLPAMLYLRDELYRKTMDSILEDSPLDLSTSLLTRALIPSPRSTSSSPHSSEITDERKSPVTSSESSKELSDIAENFDPWAQRHARLTRRAARGERALLPCEVCGKAFDRPSLLKRHMRTHTGEKPHVCMVCSKGFSTSSSLNTHRRIHSGEKPHQCQVCGKRFTASSNLYYHRMTHIKEKPHKCTLCSKSFPTPGDLKSHMYVHNGSWPFKCHICSRGFSKHTNLKNHLFLHTGDKPHACELCRKKFALACNLRAHLKTHEGEPQEECSSCGRMFLGAGHPKGQCARCSDSGSGLLQDSGSEAHSSE